MASRLQLVRDTAANWTSLNPTPRLGEPCFETDTAKLKIGDGSTAWNSLSYVQGAVSSIVGITGTKAQFNTAVTDGNIVYVSDNISSLTNDSGYITASSTNTLTNKSGNISQWTNDSGYINSTSGNWSGTFDGQEGTYYLDRANHTGNQLSTTISDFSEAVDDRVSVLIQNGTGISWSYNDSLNTLTPTVSLSSFSTSNLTEGSNLYFTDERAQDAIGIMIDSSLVYNDATPLLSRAALTGAITASAGSNSTSLGSFTLSQLNTALSDADVSTGGGTATGTNTGDVTLSGTPNYITISGQTITRGLIDLSSHVTGDLPFSNITQIATDRILGRDSVGTGDVESLTVSGGIEFTGSGGIQTSAFTGDVSKTAGGTSLTLATVNSNVGSFGSGSQVATVTVNGKGLITAVSNTNISIDSTAVNDFNEAAQDAVGTILTDTNSIDFTYNDAGNTITADVKVRNTTTANTSITASGVGVDVNNNTSTQRIEISKNSGGVIGTRKKINFIEGTNITLTITDDAGNDEVDITVNASVSGGSGISLGLESMTRLGAFF